MSGQWSPDDPGRGSAADIRAEASRRLAQASETRVAAGHTTAAGDAWNGAYAFARARGSALDVAGRFATAAASVSVTRPGAQPSMPTEAEVRALMEGRS